MNEYHKIQTVFLRDPETKYKTLLDGQWARPEFEYLAGLEWEFTEKIDGTNIRIMFDGATVAFGGKTDRAQIPSRLFAHLEDTFTVANLSSLFTDASPLVPVCLYGEGCGAKIQKGGGNYYQDQRFVLFDVTVGPWWLSRANVLDVAGRLEIPVAPVIGRGSLYNMVALVMAAPASAWGPFVAEGVVARPAVELFDRAGRRIITKLKVRDFG